MFNSQDRQRNKKYFLGLFHPSLFRGTMEQWNNGTETIVEFCKLHNINLQDTTPKNSNGNSPV